MRPSIQAGLARSPAFGKDHARVTARASINHIWTPSEGGSEQLLAPLPDGLTILRHARPSFPGCR